MGYQYDLFLSFSLSDLITEEWVKEFSNSLLTQLGQHIDKPRIYNYLEGGDIGRKTVELVGEKLKLSKRIVVLLTPNYFCAPFCVFEWQSFQKRKEHSKESLIYGVLLHKDNLEGYPANLNEFIYSDCCNHSDTNIPFKEYFKADDGKDFKEKIVQLCTSLAKGLDNVPAFDDNFSPTLLLTKEELRNQKICKLPEGTGSQWVQL